MITEDYVSFETAKLLKEKGFDEPTLTIYRMFDDDLVDMIQYNFALPNSENGKSDFACPTHQMAVKWLREKYGLHIYITWDEDRGFQPNIIDIKDDHIYHTEMYRDFMYEQIEEEAIQICLTKIIPTLNFEH